MAGLDENKSHHDSRWRELEFIQETLYKLWSIYMTYFMWLHTLVYGAGGLALIMGAEEKPSPPRNFVVLAMVVVVIAEALSIIVTVAVARYSRRALARATELIADQSFHTGIDPKVLLAAGPVRVVVPACIIAELVAALAFVYAGIWGIPGSQI
ncbi:hypothetical protein [Bradyrhizobium zhanjiangense]|uniref:Uncharacterized protein n=1 Tax=Bradyrhizobium zhanjiangense TaxID=1325107 RepID=A0A4Q0QFU5_9BRAD|nr:hypothetical protein [Bradyrhizobium zhanjiangense]RXG88737.1 hypothetical protein EAS61_29155 [Bradyrhizobium zhanjiangense]